CAPQHASIATTQGFSFAASLIIPSRRMRRRSTTAPPTSNPLMLQLFFPKSIPRTAICMTIPSESMSGDTMSPALRRGAPFHKHDGVGGRGRMRSPASEKLEIIKLVEQSHLPVRRTLEKLGIARATFYHWYDLYRSGGPDALADHPSRPSRVWNRIPDAVREKIVRLALDEPTLSPREVSVRFTDSEKYFVSEASVYRLFKAHDLIASPAFIVIKAADEFKDKTTAPNQLWQTDFTYLKVIGWGWFYLSTVLDDFSRFIIAWKLCTTMKAKDVSDTLTMALRSSGLDA